MKRAKLSYWDMQHAKENVLILKYKCVKDDLFHALSELLPTRPDETIIANNRILQALELMRAKRMEVSTINDVNNAENISSNLPQTTPNVKKKKRRASYPLSTQ